MSNHDELVQEVIGKYGISDIKTEGIQMRTTGISTKYRQLRSEIFPISMVNKLDDPSPLNKRGQKIEEIINGIAFSSMFISPFILESYFEKNFEAFAFIRNWEHIDDFYFFCDRYSFYEREWSKSVIGNKKKKIENIVNPKKILNYFLQEHPEDIKDIFPFKWGNVIYNKN